MRRASPSRCKAEPPTWAQVPEALALDLLRAMGYTRKASIKELARRVTCGLALPSRPYR